MTSVPFSNPIATRHYYSMQRMLWRCIIAMCGQLWLVFNSDIRNEKNSNYLKIRIVWILILLNE